MKIVFVLLMFHGGSILKKIVIMVGNKMQVGEKIMGFTFDGEQFVCDKCGHKCAGIIPIAQHWNECIDGGKTLSSLMTLREEKGSELTVYDIDKILP